MSTVLPSAQIGEARGAAELTAAAEVLQRAFAGQENARMGQGYARALLRSFETEPSRALLVAFVGNRLAGFAAGEPGGAQAGRYRSLRPAAAAALLRRPWLLFDPSIVRMAAQRLQKDAGRRVPPASWFLALIAVDPDFRRLGLGRELLLAFEEEGRRRGFAHATLFVHSSNLHACAVYESSGWCTDVDARDGRLLYERSLARIRPSPAPPTLMFTAPRD